MEENVTFTTATVDSDSTTPKVQEENMNFHFAVKFATLELLGENGHRANVNLDQTSIADTLTL